MSGKAVIPMETFIIFLHGRVQKLINAPTDRILGAFIDAHGLREHIQAGPAEYRPDKPVDLQIEAQTGHRSFSFQFTNRKDSIGAWIKQSSDAVNNPPQPGAENNEPKLQAAPLA